MLSTCCCASSMSRLHFTHITGQSGGWRYWKPCNGTNFAILQAVRDKAGTTKSNGLGHAGVARVRKGVARVTEEVARGLYIKKMTKTF